MYISVQNCTIIDTIVFQSDDNINMCRDDKRHHSSIG